MVTDLEPHWQAGEPTACHKVSHETSLPVIVRRQHGLHYAS